MILGEPLMILGNPLMIPGEPLIFPGEPLIFPGSPLMILGEPLIFPGGSDNDSRGSANISRASDNDSRRLVRMLDGCAGLPLRWRRKMLRLYPSRAPRCGCLYCLERDVDDPLVTRPAPLRYA